MMPHAAFSDYASVIDFQLSYSKRIETATSLILSVVSFDLYKVYGTRIREYNLKPIFEIYSGGTFMNRDFSVMLPPPVGHLPVRKATDLIATIGAQNDNTALHRFSFVPSGKLIDTISHVNVFPSVLRAKLIASELSLDETKQA